MTRHHSGCFVDDRLLRGRERMEARPVCEGGALRIIQGVKDGGLLTQSPSRVWGIVDTQSTFKEGPKGHTFTYDKDGPSDQTKSLHPLPQVCSEDHSQVIVLVSIPSSLL